MTIPRNLRKYIEAGRLDEVESAWLAQLESGPEDLEFFVDAARALKGAGEEDMARTLLELVYDEWDAAGKLELRLDLLREVGGLLFDATAVHGQILAMLRRIYSGYPSFEGFLEQVGLQRAIEDTPKVWKKTANLRVILQFEVDSIVWMKGKGAGRVTEVNFELESFKVDFERSPGLRVGFGGAAKLMLPLGPEHVLRRKIEAPEALLELKRRDAGELLLVTLRSYDEPRSATQVREALAGVVDEKEWTSFWNAARRNPQVLTEGKGARQLYRATASSADAEEAVLDAFEGAGLEGKLDIFRRNADRNPELRDRLAERLAAIAEAGGRRNLELAFAVAHALRDVPDLLRGAAWTPEAVLATVADPGEVVAGLADRGARERAYELIQAERDDWAGTFAARLDLEDDPRLLDRLAGALEPVDPESLSGFYDRVLAHPRKAPAAFVWMTERGQSDPRILDRKPLRFLQALLATSQPRELDPYRSRLRKALEDGGPVAQLLQRIEPDQAATIEELLKRCNLEEYVRTPLITALHMRFPDLRQADESPLYTTEASLAARAAELKELREAEIPANRRAIEEAREMGDLRENFEYKAARQRHEYLSSRQASLERDLARARPLDLSRADADEVRVASRVTVRQNGGEPTDLLVLGPWESDPERNIISYDSDLARALLGKSQGATVEFSGDTYEITAIAPWHGEEA
jgi:transcription elongation GreA/GreB family factor